MNEKDLVIRGWIVMLMPKIIICYYPKENLFKSPNGQIYINLQPMVTPNQIFLFKHYKKSIEFVNRNCGIIVKMLWPIND